MKLYNEKDGKAVLPKFCIKKIFQERNLPAQDGKVTRLMEIVCENPDYDEFGQKTGKGNTYLLNVFNDRIDSFKAFMVEKNTDMEGLWIDAAVYVSSRHWEKDLKSGFNTTLVLSAWKISE